MIFPWLNRLGIVLNLLASFMIAPELIGPTRLTAWETRVEQSVAWSKQLLNIWSAACRRPIGYLNALSSSIPWRIPIAVAICILIFWCNRHGYHNVTLTVLLLFYGVLVYASYRTVCGMAMAFLWFLSFAATVLSGRFLVGQWIDLTGESQTPIRWWKRPYLIMRYLGLMCLVMLPALLIALVPLVVFASLGMLIVTIVQEVLARILASLAGEERLRKIIVAWGIVLLVLGNVLQLVATWDNSHAERLQKRLVMSARPFDLSSHGPLDRPGIDGDPFL